MNVVTHIQFGDNQSALYDKTYLVVECKTHLTRPYAGHSPEAAPRCERIEVTLVAPGKDCLDLYEWYLDNSYRSGRVVFTIVDVRNTKSETVEHSIVFEDAQCFALSEKYDKKTQERRQLTLCITPQVCEVEGVRFLQYHANDKS